MAKAGSKFRLKDPKTTFFDPETRLKVVGQEEVTIDAKQRKGKLTLAAINAGGLIEVGTEPEEAKGSETAKARAKGAKDKE